VIGGVAGVGFIVMAALWVAGKKRKSAEAIQQQEMRRRASELLHSSMYYAKTSKGHSMVATAEVRPADSWGNWAVPERLPVPGRETWRTTYWGEGRAF